MKKIIISFIIIALVIVAVVLYYTSSYKMKQQEINNINSDYESYYNVEVLGTDIISIINKTIDLNEKNGIEKDDKNQYIENDTNSIVITIKFKGKDDEEFIYRMEAIAKQGSIEFVKNFGGITFKCTNIEYHEKTNMVKSLFIEQI